MSGSAAKKRVFTNKDGLDLVVFDYGGDDLTHSLPLVCLHGLTRNARDFDGLAPFLRAQGHRVLAFDVRGRGASAYDPDHTRYHPLTYAQDVLDFLDHLGIERAGFIGTSMGGIMSMIIAALAPDRIAAAVINDIGPTVDPAGLARIAGYVGKAKPMQSWAQAARTLRALGAAAFPDRDAAFWDDFARRTCREQDGEIITDYDPAIAKALLSADNAPADLWPLFEALCAVPVLVIRGALSDILSPDTLAQMGARHPAMQTIEIANTGHVPTLDEAESQRAIADFFAGVGEK